MSTKFHETFPDDFSAARIAGYQAYIDSQGDSGRPEDHLVAIDAALAEAFNQGVQSALDVIESIAV